MNRRVFLPLFFLLTLSCFGQFALPNAKVQNGGLGVPVAAAASFTYFSTVFGNGNNYVQHLADYTGNANGSQIISSFWVKFTGADGVYQVIYGNAGGDIRIERTTGNLIQYFFFTHPTIHNTTQLTAASGWHHILCTVDGNSTANCKLYVDGVDETTISVAIPNGNIGLAQTSWTVGASLNSSTDNFKLSEFYLAYNQIIDITVAGNRTKYSTTSGTLGHPVSLGATGSLPTGTAPIVYLPNGFATVNVNAGTGGDFTFVGAPTDGGADIP